MNVMVRWSLARRDSEELSFRRVLYAYLHPKTRSVLYIGKADRCSVRERLGGQHKRSVAAFLRRLNVSGVYTLVGVLYVERGLRFSSALLSDIESLLIAKVRPRANIQSIASRICRPGLKVICRGVWPIRRRLFIDVAD